MVKKNIEQDATFNRPLLHVCEVCGKTEILTPDEAFLRGWDYPPKIGFFGVISPRTCVECSMEETLWWRLSRGIVSLDNLSGKDKQIIERILQEPDILYVDGYGSTKH